MNSMNVLIAEDHAITAKLLARMLSRSSNINVVGVVSNGMGVMKMVAEKPVDIILMDITMPYLDGMQTMDQLFKKHPKVKVLILSGHTESWVIEKSLKLGASGYLTKQVDTNEVIEAITTVYNGENYLDDTSLHAIVHSRSIKKDEEIDTIL
jgi:DNA-binding NarL/FixJ family response regulator